MNGAVPTSRDEVELAHSALIHDWARFRGWLDEDRDALFERDEIRESALEWDRRGRIDDYLAHGGDRLARARAVAFSPDGRKRAASSVDAAIRIWTINPLAAPCNFVWRPLSPEERKQFLGPDYLHQPACQEFFAAEHRWTGLA